MTEVVWVYNRSDVYHTKLNCCAGTAKSDKGSPWRRDQAEEWGKTHCKYCSGELGNEYEAEEGSKPNETWPV